MPSALRNTPTLERGVWARRTRRAWFCRSRRTRTRRCSWRRARTTRPTASAWCPPPATSASFRCTARRSAHPSPLRICSVRIGGAPTAAAAWRLPPETSASTRRTGLVTQTADLPLLLIWHSRHDLASVRLRDDQAVLPALQVLPLVPYPVLRALGRGRDGGPLRAAGPAGCRFVRRAARRHAALRRHGQHDLRAPQCALACPFCVPIISPLRVFTETAAVATSWRVMIAQAWFPLTSTHCMAPRARRHRQCRWGACYASAGDGRQDVLHPAERQRVHGHVLSQAGHRAAAVQQPDAHGARR